jgi:mannose-6-phosphate isomerase-like protein (cupin superfamily)/DNA-binding XRE family transcriptional regulator
MNEEIIQIARRIKALREITGISQESLAEHLDISLEDFRSMESGKTDISVALLIRISQRLNVELSALLTGENPKLHQYCVVRKGHGIMAERKQQYNYENLAYNFVHKRAEPFIVTANPDEMTEIQYNSHPGQEFNYVLKGAMTVFFEGHEIVLNEGDSIYFDSSHKHAMKALNNQPVKFLAVTI